MNDKENINYLANMSNTEDISSAEEDTPSVLAEKMEETIEANYSTAKPRLKIIRAKLSKEQD